MADTAWQEAWVEVLPDFSNFRQKSVPQISKYLSDAGDEGGRQGARSFGSSFAGGIGKVAGVVGGAIAALGIGNLIVDAVRTGFDFIQDTIGVASDLNESINAVNVSYGEAAESVLALGEKSAQMFGLSKRELNGYATQFSSFVKTIAGPGGDAAYTLLALVGRGSDFASVFNLEVAEALQVFQSGLAGETEPLRKFGIDLSAAAVANYALANGIAASASEMTEAEKVQARYGLLMQQTRQVSDDFANTSDQLANKNRINAATWDDLQAKIGEGFLPIASELATIVSNDVLPAISSLVDKHGPELTKTFQDAVPAISEFVAEIIPLLPQLIEMGGEALPLVIAGGQALLPLLSWLTENTTGWFAAVGALFALMAGDTTVIGFTQTAQQAGGVLGWLINQATTAGAAIGTFAFNVRNFGTNAAMWLSQKVNEMVGYVQSLPQRAMDAIGNIGNLLYSSGRSLIQGFINGIGSMLKPVGDAVAGVLDWAMGFFPNSPAQRGPLSGSGWNSLAKSGEAVMSQFTSGFGRAEMTGRLTPALGAVQPAVRSQFATSASTGTEANRGPLNVNVYDVNGVYQGTIRGEIAAADAAAERELARKGMYR